MRTKFPGAARQAAVPIIEPTAPVPIQAEKTPCRYARREHHKASSVVVTVRFSTEQEATAPSGSITAASHIPKGFMVPARARLYGSRNTAVNSPVHK